MTDVWKAESTKQRWWSGNIGATKNTVSVKTFLELLQEQKNHTWHRSEAKHRSNTTGEGCNPTENNQCREVIIQGQFNRILRRKTSKIKQEVDSQYNNGVYLGLVNKNICPHWPTVEETSVNVELTLFDSHEGVKFQGTDWGLCSFSLRLNGNKASNSQINSTFQLGSDKHLEEKIELITLKLLP